MLRVLTRPNLGGPTLQAAALFAEHAAAGVSTLLAVGRCPPHETAVDLQARGVPRLEAAAVAPGSAGFVELLALGNRWSPAGNRAARRELVRLCRAFRPQVVHTHTSKAGWLGRRAARRALVPVVAHTFHGHVLRGYFDPVRAFVLARLEAALARRTDLLFAVGESCADELAALGVAPRARLLVLPPAVPAATPGRPLCARAEARQALGAGPDDWLVACVGRLVAIKRVDRFVAAVAALPGCRGHVVGDGPQAAALRRALPGDGRVQMRGADPAIAAVLPGYDALVIPSAREGLPLVAVEAFAAGVPVVGFDVPGVRDALAGGAGVLVPEAQGAAGLAAALRRLRTDAPLRARCTERGRAELPRYAPREVAERLLEAYRAALRARVGYAARRGG